MARPGRLSRTRRRGLAVRLGRRGRSRPSFKLLIEALLVGGIIRQHLVPFGEDTLQRGLGFEGRTAGPGLARSAAPIGFDEPDRHAPRLVKLARKKVADRGEIA